MSSLITVAIDGPTASGKGTLARRLAQRFGLAYLDSGALYRATARDVLAAGEDPKDAEAAARRAAAIDPASLGDPRLRDEDVGQGASVVAAHPSVRAALFEYQRSFVKQPPGGARGAVLDGRDIGTVICPDATVKLYVTASVEARALRRTRELEGRGETVDAAAVRADLEARDARDMNRAIAPLKPAEDAILLDTTDLDAAEALARAIEVVERRLT